MKYLVIINDLFYHWPLADTSKEKSSSTTPSPGLCPSDRQNLDTTSRKKELQQPLMAACCWSAALNHKKEKVTEKLKDSLDNNILVCNNEFLTVLSCNFQEGF